MLSIVYIVYSSHDKLELKPQAKHTNCFLAHLSSTLLEIADLIHYTENNSGFIPQCNELVFYFYIEGITLSGTKS